MAVLVRKMGGFEETRRSTLSRGRGIDVVKSMEKCTVWREMTNVDRLVLSASMLSNRLACLFQGFVLCCEAVRL